MSQPQPPPQDLTGNELGDYRVLRRVGSGGMAEVYLAEQRSLERQVALKVLHERLADDASYVERFAQEARAAAKLVHPNIVQIYDVGQADGFHFISQEYVPGKNLGQLLERQGALEPGLVLDILRQVVSALCRSHELKIVHRDIKPENIMLSHSGEVKVADFGLARITNTDTKTLTQVGVTMGTPLYMSPEQIEGRPIDIRSDIYSLGITCYHLLSGQPPHNGDTALAIAMQHLNTLPTPLENLQQGLPSALARMVHQMLAKKPENRPANPGELLLALRSLATTAAEEGWAEGPDAWTLAEWIATEETRSPTSKQLSDLMKQETSLQAVSRQWGGALLLAAAALVAGLAVAAVTRPKPYLNGFESPEVPTRETAEAQLFYAKLTDSPDAWISVWEKFPKADPYLHQLARQGLVRRYLLVSQDYQAALREIGQLEGSLDTSDEALVAFVYSCKCIAFEHLGDKRQAMAALEQVTPDLSGLLQTRETQINDLFESSQRRLRD